MKTNKTLIYVAGPTGIGKTDFSIKVAKKFNTAVFPGYQGGPLMHIIAAKAAGFLEALQPEFQDYIKSVLANAKILAET